MGNAHALHIGLNRVDPAAYAGWEGRLGACENDAVALHSLTTALGYRAQLLLSRDATTAAVFGAVAEAAQTLVAGDIFVLTYAGHGGQFDDLSGDEEDAADETWLLYNREILDDEVHQALAAFADGVRVVVLSDSCYSGTVIRRLTRGARWHTPRAAPPWVQKQVLELDRPLYEAIRRRTPRPAEVPTAASVLLISGCQDDQVSMEGDEHGAFTEAILEVWADGSFTGDYEALHAGVVAALPADQVPNLFLDGRPWPEFVAQVPFTTVPPAGPTAAVTPTPSVGGAPVLKVTLSVETTATPENLTDLLSLLDGFVRADGGRPRR